MDSVRGFAVTLARGRWYVRMTGRIGRARIRGSLGVLQHVVHRCLDRFVAEGGITALGGHESGLALKTLDGVLVKRVLALSEALLPDRRIT